MTIEIKEKGAVLQPEDAANILKKVLAAEQPIDQDKEHFWIFGLNSRNLVQYLELVSLGTLNASLVHPREVFRLAVMKGIAQTIMAHNHPSGDPEPSRDDLLITKRLVESGKVSLSASGDGGLITVADAAASFQEAVIEVLVTKTIEAARECRVRQILLAGGVASNQLLRRRLQENSTIPVLIPQPELCTDNAAMIAACGYYRFRGGRVDGLDLDVVPGLKLA